MSKLNIFLILLLVGMLAYARIESASASTTPQAQVAIFPIATPTPTPIPVGKPVTIQIPKLGTNAIVEPVGTDFTGRMSMPGDWQKAAWYSGDDSYKPGEKGNAVIAGHLDTIYGTLGQFYNLDQIAPGDEVIVTDEFGQIRKFIVTDKQQYEYDKAPLDKIFGPSDQKNLNLITCTGWYNVALQTYSHRLIVYTRLEE